MGQVLDIGTGLASASNTHQVAQAVAPECRVFGPDREVAAWSGVARKPEEQAGRKLRQNRKTPLPAT
jgi:hypothetical protein